MVVVGRSTAPPFEVEVVTNSNCDVQIEADMRASETLRETPPRLRAASGVFVRSGEVLGAASAHVLSAPLIAA